MRKTWQKLVVITIFALAMAYLEAAIVAYLRELYYPDGFNLDLVRIPDYIVFIEIGREAATILMIWAIAYLTAADARSTFAYFCINFGVWDIGYYLWLKVLLDWPSTLLDWDVLFLIPLPWISPVLAPIIISIALIIAALFILKYDNLRLSLFDWSIEATAGLLVILSFLRPPDSINRFDSLAAYPWWLFTIGLVLGLAVFIRRLWQAQKSIRFRAADLQNNR